MKLTMVKVIPKLQQEAVESLFPPFTPLLAEFVSQVLQLAYLPRDFLWWNAFGEGPHNTI